LSAGSAPLQNQKSDQPKSKIMQVFGALILIGFLKRWFGQSCCSKAFSQKLVFLRLADLSEC
jgi:hypothetical protein